jgi:polysaccharide export outer membrane protein
MRIVLISVLVTCVVCASAHAQTRSGATVAVSGTPAKRTVQPDEKPADASMPDGYVIGPEDVLSINVWREQELSSKVSVRPDGKIGLPLLNDTQASGYTPTQLQEKIADGLKKFVTNPQVSVIVLEIRSQNVYIIGGVAKPGVYALGGPMTVMELLVRAGGLTEFAKSEDIQILRNESGKQVQHRFNFKRFSEGQDYRQNIQLRNGDMVIVR